MYEFIFVDFNVDNDSFDLHEQFLIETFYRSLSKLEKAEVAHLCKCLFADLMQMDKDIRSAVDDNSEFLIEFVPE